MEGSVTPSGANDFWENGGLAIATAKWSAAEGMSLSKGNVCYDKYGFCFSILEGRMNPVITVEPKGQVEVDLTANFKPEEE